MSKAKTTDQIFRKFAEGMQKGNVNRILKLLTNNMQHGILPLIEETILTLKMKHPQAVDLELEVLLPDVAPNIHPMRFESITAEEVWKVAMRTKGGSGPSGLDTDGLRKILRLVTVKVF